MNWTLLRQTALLWTTVYCAAAAVDHLRWVLTWRGLAEAGGWLLVLSLLAALPAVDEFVSGLRRAHRWFLASVVATLLFGQFMGGQPERSFPVVMWRMFSGDVRRLAPFTFFAYTGETEAGGRIPLSPPRLFPPLDSYRMTHGLAELVERSLAAKARGEPEEGRLLDDVLAGVGQTQTATHTGERIRRVGVERCRFDPEIAPAGAISGCERIWTADVPPERR